MDFSSKKVPRFWQNIREAIQNKEVNPEQFSRYFIGTIVEKKWEVETECLNEKNIKRIYYLGDRLDKNYLTAREADCMALMMKGYTNREVAQQLQLSARTVEFYIKNMRQRLGCYSKVHLIETVRQLGFSYELAGMTEVFEK